MSGEIQLKNQYTAQSVVLKTPFDEQEYYKALVELGIQFSKDDNIFTTDYADDNALCFDVIMLDTDVPYPCSSMMDKCDNPVVITLAERAYDEAKINKEILEEYVEWVNPLDLECFMNICLQPEDIPFYGFEYGGYGYEGFGRQMMEWNGEPIPEWAESYFDFEQYGCDYADGSNFIVLEDGYIDFDADEVNDGYYDIDDIMDKLYWDPNYEPSDKTIQSTFTGITQDAMFNFL